MTLKVIAFNGNQEKMAILRSCSKQYLNNLQTRK